MFAVLYDLWIKEMCEAVCDQMFDLYVQMFLKIKIYDYMNRLLFVKEGYVNLHEDMVA